MGFITKNVPPESNKKQSGTTVVAEGNQFSGEMKIVGKMHIDGVFDGTITSLDNISIGKKGRVRGVIQARHINVSGLLEGEVTCDELHIEPDGLVQAIVASKQMSISPKGSFIGERRKWEQSGDETDIKALSSEADITESDAEKVLVNQE